MHAGLTRFATRVDSTSIAIVAAFGLSDTLAIATSVINGTPEAIIAAEVVGLVVTASLFTTRICGAHVAIVTQIDISYAYTVATVIMNSTCIIIATSVVRIEIGKVITTASFITNIHSAIISIIAELRYPTATTFHTSILDSTN